MPINVRPEFMEAAEKHLREFDPSTDWKDSALALSVAAFGQSQFDRAADRVPEGVRHAFRAASDHESGGNGMCVRCDGSYSRPDRHFRIIEGKA